MPKRQLDAGQLRVVIPSRKRAEVLKQNALQLFPYATVSVAEQEYDDYLPLFEDNPGQLTTHPDNVSGIAPIRQWVLDNFHEECILFVDDDVYSIRSSLGYKGMYLRGPGAALRLVMNAANIAKGIGTAFFGFNQAGGDVRKFRPQKPFLLDSWAGGVVGIIGRDIRYDTGLRLRADIDFVLQTLQHKRITFIDNRFAFLHRRFGLTGGNAGNRSQKRNQEEIDYLLKKWGHWIDVRDVKTTTRIIVKVPRSQSFIKLANDV
jgi:hypothetical protein